MAEREHESWHAPTGLSGLDEPAQLWWWVLVGHARELDYLTRELNLTAEQREVLMRLQTAYRAVVARWDAVDAFVVRRWAAEHKRETERWWAAERERQGADGG